MKPFEVALVAIGKGVGVMTGSKLIKSGDDTLIIHGLKASRKYKAVHVEYKAGLDLFDMTFYRKRGDSIERVESLYIDQLRDVFEDKTGLYTSL